MPLKAKDTRSARSAQQSSDKLDLAQKKELHGATVYEVTSNDEARE